MYCTPSMSGPGWEAGSQTQGPAQAVGVSALGTGWVKGQRSALSGDRNVSLAEVMWSGVLCHMWAFLH